MATAVHALGKCQILVDTGASNALELLGYSEDQVTIEERVFRHDIHSDEYGGGEGPPIDVQYLGEVHYITMSLVNYDIAIYKKIQPKIYGGSLGVSPNPGSLMGEGSLAFRLLLKPITDPYGVPTANEPRNYLLAFPFSSVRWAMGTKATRVPLVWEAHATQDAADSDTVKLFNNTAV
ncbi:MAG: hypothetical protein VW362_06095 [Candidatus Nanopelagicales bacterium]